MFSLPYFSYKDATFWVQYLRSVNIISFPKTNSLDTLLRSSAESDATSKQNLPGRAQAPGPTPWNYYSAKTTSESTCSVISYYCMNKI